MRALAVDAPLAIEERQDVLDAIVEIVDVFAHDWEVVGAACCALFHASAGTVPLPVSAVLAAARRHERAHVAVLHAAARLLALHAATSHVNLPSVAEAMARWTTLHPREALLGHYVAHVMVRLGGLEPDHVRAFHSRAGCDALDVAIVTAAVASRVEALQVQGQPWQWFVLGRLYPRLRSDRAPPAGCSPGELLTSLVSSSPTLKCTNLRHSQKYM